MAFAFPWASAISGGLQLAGNLLGNRANARAAQQQMAFQNYMSSTAHQREVADLRAAGLNPILSATGGMGASSPSSAMPYFGNPFAGVTSSALEAASTERTAADTRKKEQDVNIDKPKEDAAKLVGTVTGGVTSGVAPIVESAVKGAVEGATGLAKSIAGDTSKGSPFDASNLPDWLRRPYDRIIDWFGTPQSSGAGPSGQSAPRLPSRGKISGATGHSATQFSREEAEAERIRERLKSYKAHDYSRYELGNEVRPR